MGEWFFSQIEKIEIGKLPKDKEEKFSTIYHLLEEKHTGWNKYFDILKEYVDEKNALPTAKETYKSVDIGKWFLTQKMRYKNNLLTSEKEKMLESLSIPFSAVMTVDPKIWEAQYNIYRSYYDIYQKEPTSDVVIENLNLSNWQYAQKLLIKRDRLSKEQEELLRKVGITATKYKDIWFDNFELLKKYFLEYNREPERKTVYENFSLGRWYYKQKDAYEDNKLSDEQKEVFKTFINDVECRSISKYDAIWLEHYENLKLYIEKNKKYPQKDDSTDIAFKNLYNWMISQRHLYRANKLSQYRIDKLNEINFAWKNEDIANGYEQKWHANFIRLSAFFEVYGRLPICSDIKEPEIGKLYFWVNDQRKAYKNGLLKPDRLEQLRSIGLDFEAPETDMNAFEKKMG
ncbi:MAG: helicase associated domain-containing protein [Firmicutes bacterium]|nr:helicase associated domain-containing protein [Bacillota bacterium]